jgi:hypothetical protein
MSTHIINFPGADIHTTTITSVSNVSVGENLDVHGTANVGVLSATLPLATVASNLVTYDTATGQLLDSNGLVSNKLSIVSEQPPAALTGDSTVVDGHGRYKVTSSSEGSEPDFGDWNCFNKVTGSATSAWSSDQTYDTVTFLHDGTQSIGGIDGEWVKLELPYKTRLRHISLQARSEGDIKQLTPGTFSIIGSNDDSSWTLLKQITGVAASDYSSATQKQFVIDASASYKYYALVVEKIVGGSYASTNPRAIIGEWRLFTETFTVDAGVVSTTAASGLDVGYTEHPVEPMKDYHTYVEGHGTYEASASNVNSTLYPWQAFDHVAGSVTRWTIASPSNQYNTTTGEWDQAAITAYPNIYTDDVGGTRYAGHWLQIKLPYAITLSHSNVHPTNGYGLDRAPKDGVILGSNDGEHWYKLTEFTGKAYSDNTWTRIDVNATTSYQYYRMCITKVVGGTYGSYSELTEWRLFAEKPVTRMENVHISGDLSSETLQTGYIKWPKVPLKAAESEGYVASASNVYPGTTNYLAFRAFDDQTTFGAGTAYAWITGPQTFDATDGTVDSSNAVTFDSLSCHWIQLQSPQAFAVSHFDFDRRESEGYSTIIPQETPKEGYLYASNDGVDWTRIQSFSDLPKLGPHDWHRVDVENSTPYTYYRLVVTKIHPGNIAGYCGVSNLRFFEAATGVGAAPTSAKLQVAGSLGMAKGSEFFAGDDVVMELPKHDRPLVKYPEVAMTANSSGGYVASASSYYNINNYPPYEAFNGVYGTELDMWISSNYVYLSDGTADTANCATFNGVYGEYLSLSMPKKIKLEKIRVHSRNNPGSSQSPENGRIYGSNDNSTWTQIGTYTGLNMLHNDYRTIIVNASEYYKDYTFQIEKMKQFGTATYTCIAELEYHGTEEGDTSVDVVHRSIPNKPGQQHLEVYWDANDSNSYSFADSSSVYDLSGSGVTGTITGNNGFDAEYNAWVFDGSGDYISGTQGLGTGQPVHSQSVWFKRNGVTGTYQYINIIGTSGGGTQAGFVIMNNGVTLQTSSYGNDIRTIDTVEGQWYHAVLVHTGGDWTSSNTLTYVNGELATVTSVSKNSTFNLTGTTVTLGTNTNGTEGFNGSIANFRLFSKVLNADQVRELYEYDAPRFGHRQNLVALHKGNLGVGVAHPTSRFEVAGADGLQEYPPKAMTGYETYMEGHGVFRASHSLDYNLTPYRSWNAFDKTITTVDGNNGWASGPDTWDGSGSVSPDTSNVPVFDGVQCHWLALKLPYAVNPSKVTMQARNDAAVPTEVPQKGRVYGSKDGQTWDQITAYSIRSQVATLASASDNSPISINLTTNEYYKHLLFTVEERYGGAVGTPTWTSIGELRYFCTPAPSSLEDGHLTLGKALTLPRVSGHPAGAETPRAESLVVHYDTTVDSVVSDESTVVDVSGNGINGTLTNGAAYSSADRALVFDGVDDYIDTSAVAFGGDQSCSINFWIKSDLGTDGLNVNTEYGIFHIGTSSNGMGLSIFNNHTSYGDSIWIWVPGKFSYYSINLTANKWYHMSVVYGGGGIGGTNVHLYIDNVKITRAGTVGTTTATPAFTSTNTVRIGDWFDSSSPFYRWTGSISNFKLYDVALTAEEVAMEYALGRTGKSLNLTDTSLCLGGTVPRAQLDVRGGAVVDGYTRIGYPGTTDKKALAPLDVRGNYIQSSAFANGTVSTAARFGSSDGMLHVSSIKTSNGAETLALQTTIDNRTMDYNIKYGWTYGSDSRHALCLQPYKGNVGIGVTNPTCLLDLGSRVQNRIISLYGGSSSGDTAYYGFGINSSTLRYNVVGSTSFHRFYGGNTQFGYVNNGNGFVNSFTGQHKSFPDESLFGKTPDDLCGLIVSASGEYISINDKVPQKGQGAIQVSEAIPTVKLSTSEKDKKVFGVVSDVEDVETSQRHDHYGAFVSTFEKELGDSRIYVNSIGEGAMWVVNTAGALESGDYITTSNVAGYGQRQEDDILHNYTVAKITMDCDFNPPDIPVQRIVKELSNVNYWVKTTYSNVSLEEYSNLAEENRTTTTETVYTNEDHEITTDKYNTLESNVQSTYTELTRIIHQKMSTEEYKTEQEGTTLEVRQELVNVLDEHGQLQWEDTDETEKAYKIRYLDASGQITDEANAVHTAAFVGVTYHCG